MKEKIDLLAVFSGIILLIIGSILVFVAFLFSWFFLIYAFILIILGIIILSSLKEQERIERVKSRI